MTVFKPLCLGLFLLLAEYATGQYATGQQHTGTSTLDTLINAGPYRLRFKILKGTNPPVLFESGGGLDSSQWDLIATVVHEQLAATVITYDRAGFGKSNLDTANYSILQEIESLETALAQLGYQQADFLLVGHSLGGFYNRVFAARHPRQVKAIVLLDPRIPSRQDMKLARDYFQTLNRKDFEAGYMSLYYLLANMEHMSDYVRHLPLPEHIPLLDVMAENGPFTEKSQNDRFKAAQRKLVKGYKNRKLLMANGSSHNIPYDKPDLVIEQIRDCYEKYLMKD